MSSGQYTYAVFVDDNFRYQDEDARYKLGDFETYAEAVAACKGLVDEYIEENWSADQSAMERYNQYTGFGPDPFILTDDPVAGSSSFSAWNYAKCQCESTEAKDDSGPKS